VLVMFLSVCNQNDITVKPPGSWTWFMFYQLSSTQNIKLQTFLNSTVDIFFYCVMYLIIIESW
jgi:hypothetical protein